MRGPILALALACFSVLTVYTQYVFLNTTDNVTHRGFRELSLEQYHDTLDGRRPFPYQWRVAGPWIVRAGERLTGIDPHAIDVVVKIGALSLSALLLMLFSARWTTSVGTLLATAMYFALSAAASSSEGYSIYCTNDFLMIAGWFACVWLIATRRYAAAAVVVFVTAWAKETVVLAPILVAFEWRDGKARSADVLLVVVAFLVPMIVLRSYYPAPLRYWAWWGNITLNVPFLRDAAATRLAIRDNLKLLLMYNVLWGLAVATVVRARDRLLHNLALVGVIYLGLAYVVVVIRELRHFLPLAIVILPLATVEIERMLAARDSR
jgi:hypothetical protein